MTAKAERIIIIAAILVFALLFFIVILIFALNFSEHHKSDDTAEWGQAGDYFGGFLNPILAAINLIVLGYLTHRISRLEHERAKIAYKPLISFSKDDKQNLIRITIKNAGNGPMTILSISMEKNGECKPMITDWFPHKEMEGAAVAWWAPKYYSVFGVGDNADLIKVYPIIY